MRSSNLYPTRNESILSHPRQKGTRSSQTTTLEGHILVPCNVSFKIVLPFVFPHFLRLFCVFAKTYKYQAVKCQQCQPPFKILRTKKKISEYMNHSKLPWIRDSFPSLCPKNPDPSTTAILRTPKEKPT